MFYEYDSTAFAQNFAVGNGKGNLADYYLKVSKRSKVLMYQGFVIGQRKWIEMYL